LPGVFCGFRRPTFSAQACGVNQLERLDRLVDQLQFVTKVGNEFLKVHANPPCDGSFFGMFVWYTASPGHAVRVSTERTG
jgi:hypothetical protein